MADFPKKPIEGAGGTPGGIGSFFIGLIMMCVGWYWILNSIMVTNSFHLSSSLYQADFFGGMSITSGMILVPMIFGIGMIFFNSRNPLGWVLAVGALAALVFGVIVSMRFSFRHMSLFDLLVVFVMAFGGTGLFLRSLRDSSRR
jgi:hypothetical protein